MDALVQAFLYFSRVPKRVIFNNGKVAVKDGFGIHAKKQARYAALAAHHGFEAVLCNLAYGNEKGLVEVLAGYSRRNTCVSILRVDTIDVLNQMFRIKCQKYVSHQVCGKEASIIDCRYYTVSLQFVLQSYSYHVALDVRFVYQYFSREYGHTQSIHSHIVFPLPAMHPSHCSQQ